jgi:hypothetical protein
MKSSNPQKPERKILSLKTDLVLIILFVLSIALYWLFFHLDSQEFPTLKEISKLLANSFLVSSIIGYIFEKILRRETEEKISSDINSAIKSIEDNLPSILVNTILYNKSLQKELLSGEKINEIFTSCLEYKLNDKKMAVELRDSFFEEIFHYHERWYNLVHYISFEQYSNTELSQDRKDNYLIFKDHVSYKSILNKPRFKFICTKINIGDEAYMKNETYCSVWHLRPAFLKCLASPYFYIDSFKINNIPLKIRQSQIAENILQLDGYNENLVHLIGKEVQFDYVVRSLVRKASNFFSVKIPVPTRDVRVTFDVRNTGVGRISVIPFFISKTSIQKQPNDELNPTIIEFYLSDWVFPISGISCIWQNERIKE